MLSRVMWFTHYRARKLEWSISLYTVLFGLWVLIPPRSMATSGYSPVLAMLPEWGWGLVYAITGSLHMIALHVNGRGWWTPFARLAALIVNSQVFLGLSMAFASSNPYGTAPLTYGAFAIVFCGPAIWTAAVDCGREAAIWRGRHG